MTKKNFLLGKGERLVEPVDVRSFGGPKIPPYTFSEAKGRIIPMLKAASTALDTLDLAACPSDQAVATITLNPDYIAKSYYPSNLFHAAGITPVGSRPIRITPEKRSAGKEAKEAISTELFVMGTRSAFRNWANSVSTWQQTTEGASELVTIEKIAAPAPPEKLIKESFDTKSSVYEVILHSDELRGENFFIPKFREYLKTMGINAGLERRFYAGGLCFLQLDIPADKVTEVAKFTIVRAVRHMPPLRMLQPAIRTNGASAGVVTLPLDGPLDANIRVAIFDGGLPANHPVTKWATPIDAIGVGPSKPELLQHGVGVTSAFLFGHLKPGEVAARPYAKLDHYRVIDDAPGQNRYELFEILGRIHNVLTTSKYDLVNLSLGPQLPITDTEVHAWTAVLDEYLANGECLTTIAVGNDGEGDAEIAANRIQVPADCVNALSVGSANSPDEKWTRAPYSSVGPGRSPGLVKPDLVAFGGAIERPYLVLHDTMAPKLMPTGGTSFAAPEALRLAAGIRAHLGVALSPLAIKALLVHTSEASEIPHNEIGWGRMAQRIDNVLLCADDTVRVVYQGTVTASKYVRVPIPMPEAELKGMVTITATLCYATKVDPHHPGNYTRAGLEPFFRPNKDVKNNPEARHASTKSFFGKNRPGMTEDELRRDAWKWENCQHASNRFRADTLKSPVFDIHYNARAESHNDTLSQELNYAMIVTVKAPKMTDLYDQVLRRYRSQLEALSSVIEVPIQLKK